MISDRILSMCKNFISKVFNYENIVFIEFI